MAYHEQKHLMQDSKDAKTSILVAGPQELRAQARNLKMIADTGIREPKVLFMLIFWYFFSGVTLFLNKYFLNTVDEGSMLLGTSQVIITTFCSFIQLYYPCGMVSDHRKPHRIPKFPRLLFLVGFFRFLTIWLGLVALDYVAVSFAETVKCSAPIFTVIISRFITGEPATAPIILSLIPIMTGLAFCSAHELSFNLFGFIAALGTNVSECIQSVYSKVLISGDKCSPVEVQFYSGFLSMAIVVPAVYFGPLPLPVWSLNSWSGILLLVCGLSFHLQSISANILMGFLSPTTYSVSNTVKRALLIWCSVLIFGNPVTIGAWFGTGLMLIGIVLYNRAKTAVIVAVSSAE